MSPVVLAGLLGLALPEPVAVSQAAKDGSLPIPIFAPARPDGRVVLMLDDGEPVAGLPGGRTGERVRSLVERGCVVAVMGTSGKVDPMQAGDSPYEKAWRGVFSQAQKVLKERGAPGEARLVFLAPGCELADPIPFYRHEGRELMMDVAYHPNAPSRGVVVRVQSGMFGADFVFRAAHHGYATVEIPDPFAQLQLGQEVPAYARAVAETLRRHSKPLNLNGAIAIGGKSKHGYSAGVLGANREAQTDRRLFQAAIVVTDTLDPATRNDDFQAAGIEPPSGSGCPDATFSPFHLVKPGGPAYYIRDAHGRVSRQSRRMIEALEAAKLPYEQSWYPGEAHYVPPSAISIVRFLDKYCVPDPQ